MAEWHHRLNGHEFETVKDREAWRAAVHGVTKSRTWLSEQQQQQYSEVLKTAVCSQTFSLCNFIITILFMNNVQLNVSSSSNPRFWI